MVNGRWLLHGVRVRYYMREYCFLPSWDMFQLTRSEPVPPPLVSAWDAESAIRMNTHSSEYGGARVLEELYAAVTRSSAVPSLSPRDLEERMLSTVLDAVKYGTLVAVEVVHSSPPQYSAAVEPPPEQPAEERPPATFDLQVVLDVDGSPVGLLSLGVKEPASGEFHALRTDGGGNIHLAHTVRGTCDVRADVKGARLDQSAVVVGSGAARIEDDGAPPPDDAAPIRYVVKLEEYRVRDGDTAMSVARRAGMSWPDLAYFNWGTRMPAEINKHLVSKVGCTKKGGDGNFVFSGDDWPGIVRFPKPFFKDGLPTDQKNVLRVKHIPPGPEVFIINLHIDPADPQTRDDSYILLNEDGSEHQRKHVGDDAVPGDDHLTLVFTGLRRGLAYSLLINEGREGEHFAFHNVLLDDLLETTADSDAKIDDVGPCAEPEDYDSIELEEGFPEIAAELREPRRSTSGATVDRPPTEGVNDPIV